MLYPVDMPLSDHERKLLAEMEAAFAQDDPRLASTLTGKARTRQGSRALLGLLLLLGGMVVLFAGLIAKVIAVGLLGFIIALTGVFLIATNLRFGGAITKTTTSKKAKRASWSSRLEERWDRRNFG